MIALSKNQDRLTVSPIHNQNVERRHKLIASQQKERIEKQLRIVKVQKQLRNEWQTQMAQTRYISNAASEKRRIDEDMREKLKHRTKEELRKYAHEKERELKDSEIERDLHMRDRRKKSNINDRGLQIQQSVPWIRDPDTSVSIVHDRKQIECARAIENQNILPYLKQLKAATSGNSQKLDGSKTMGGDTLTLTEKRIGVLARACARTGLPLEHEGKITTFQMHASPQGAPSQISSNFSKPSASKAKYNHSHSPDKAHLGRTWILNAGSYSKQQPDCLVSNIEQFEVMEGSRTQNESLEYQGDIRSAWNDVDFDDLPQPFEAMFDAPGAILHDSASQVVQIEQAQEMARIERMKIVQMYDHASKLQDKVRNALSSFETKHQRERAEEARKTAEAAEKEATRFAKRLADAITPVAYITPQSYLAKQQANLRKSKALRQSAQFGEATKIRVPFRRSTTSTAMPTSLSDQLELRSEALTQLDEKSHDTIKFHDSEMYDDLVPSEILQSHFLIRPKK